MENITSVGDILTLERLKITTESSVPVFVVLLLIYIFIVVSNIGLVVLIFRTRSLQQPMYLLLCNMSINDVFGATIVVPEMLRDLLISDSERLVRYADCAVQAFCVHLHASASHTVLIIMAFDRYVAICRPLRYAGVMTSGTVAVLSASAWGTALLMVAILVGLTSACHAAGRSYPTCSATTPPWSNCRVKASSPIRSTASATQWCCWARPSAAWCSPT